MNAIRRLDQLLNGLTMYRLVLYGLAIVAAIAITYGFMGAIGYGPVPLLAMLVILLVVCWVSNQLFAVLTNAAPNTESSLITALILFFILAPPSTATDGLWLAAAGLVAMASKYVLAWRGKHIFNPAAITAVILTATGLYPVLWWVATPPLLPFVIALGVLVGRKIRRMNMIGIFIGAALLVMVLVGLTKGVSPLESFLTAYLSWPLVFFGCIMVTEPSTTPPRYRWQLVYAASIGALFSSQLHVGPFFTDPQTVLVLANLVVFLTNPRYSLRLRLKARHQLAPRIYEYEFELPRPIAFEAGQYLEFTLPHPHPDGRGNRRTFSIASSPTEPTLKLGVKHVEPASSFKTALASLKPGSTLMAASLMGNFTLPADASTKLTFIAGGIGITPFRSMLKYVLDSGGQRNIVVLYAVSDPAEAVYHDVLDAAAAAGVRVVPVTGAITTATVTEAVPDYAERTHYVSGPPVMVDGCRAALAKLGVKAGRIRTDHFSGY